MKQPFNFETESVEVDLKSQRINQSGRWLRQGRQIIVFLDTEARSDDTEIYEKPFDYEGPEAVAAGAAVVITGFEILKSIITPMTQGDIQVMWPTSPIGVKWPGKPPGLRLRALTTSRLIINWVERNPITRIEQVNVKLRCHVQYNGPETEATFSFDAEGHRSRLGRDTTISIGNPLSLETQPAPADWQRVGVREYPVVRIPMEFRVDRPWPHDNYNETFTLVLSGMYGFGASARDRQYIKDRRVRYT